ncbi:MAG: hypothetical protein HQ595_00705 [Candidatus Omnitrophica bacterium]|nr:hypothetical protein [Candidatus Omnitrophota bacterium]
MIDLATSKKREIKAMTKRRKVFYVRSKIITLLFLAVFFVPSLCWATAHYVDKNASGSNDGSSWANAWNSLTTIDWGDIGSGDIIYVSGGSSSKTYFETLSVGANGIDGNPVLITKGTDEGHNGTVIIDAEYKRNRGIYIGDYDYLTIDGFTIRNVGGSGTNAAIELYRSDYVTIQNCIIQDFRRFGIFVNGYTPNYCNEIKVLNCTIENEDGTYNYQTDNLYVQYTIGFEAGGNTITHHYNSYPDQHSDAIQTNFIDGTFLFHGNLVQTVGGGSINTNNWIMGYLDGTIKIYNNVILGSSGHQWHAIQIRKDSGYTATLEMYNNYIKSQHSTGYVAQISISDVIFKNNILHSFNNVTVHFENGVDTNSNCDYNLYYRETGTAIAGDEGGQKTWSQWQAAGYDAHGLNSNPSLDANYAPDETDDPAVDAGTTIPFFSTDMVGKTRPHGSAWDIGVFELITNSSALLDPPQNLRILN